MASERTELLRHSPGEMIIGITRSPGGRDCVGMTFEGKEWVLLTTKTVVMISTIKTELKKKFNVASILGPPVDWRASIESHELKLIESSEGISAIGIFVEAGKFDELVSSMSNL